MRDDYLIAVCCVLVLAIALLAGRLVLECALLSIECEAKERETVLLRLALAGKIRPDQSEADRRPPA